MRKVRRDIKKEEKAVQEARGPHTCQMNCITRDLLAVKPFAERQQMPRGRGWISYDQLL